MPVPPHGLLRGALAGALAGLAASWVMDRFQDLAARAGAAPEAEGDPTTVKAAEALAGPLREAAKEPAGAAVHYGFGALLGALYGAACAVEPRLSAGFGLPYGAATALVADEALVPAAGLSAPPWRTPPPAHAYALASHLVFGAALEAARRELLGRA